MGDDTPLSVLNDPPRPLYTYFRQKFAQVTNPPIDSIRERNVMSLDTWLGRRHSLLEEAARGGAAVAYRIPVMLDDDIEAMINFRLPGFSVTTLDGDIPRGRWPGRARGRRSTRSATTSTTPSRTATAC